ncbi:hypothetical protein BLNAU_7322 [Blattamonas nauphoetae]|uniref:Uncharacterized protein n=1 Tax=Blattamonas nauphoetae TaxID=2049346 RepID=A0ABQ9Y1Q6_9EUKA|nr:hypothetical protein BLNAU_7322 [Blattamonas nauphoetae]
MIESTHRKSDHKIERNGYSYCNSASEKSKMAARLFDAAAQISGGCPDALLEYTVLSTKRGQHIRSNLELELNGKYSKLLKSLGLIYASLAKRAQILLLSALASIVSLSALIGAGFETTRSDLKNSYQTIPHSLLSEQTTLQMHIQHAAIQRKTFNTQISELDLGTAIVLYDYKENWKFNIVVSTLCKIPSL